VVEYSSKVVVPTAATGGGGREGSKLFVFQKGQ
jgi:hypothetical protein